MAPYAPPANQRKRLHEEAAPCRLPGDATPPAVTQLLLKEGYVIIEDVVDVEKTTEIRKELERLLEKQSSGRDAFEGRKSKKLYTVVAHTRVADSLLTHSLVLAVARNVIGEYAQLNSSVVAQVLPGEIEQQLHRDADKYPISCRACTNCNTVHQEIIINSMWALTPFTLNNGATHVVPRSQNVTRPLPNQVETYAAGMRPGSVLLWLGNTVHGAGANVSTEPRLGLIVEYSAGWLRPTESNLIALPPNRVQELPPELQKLIGYNILPVFVGSVNGTHPLKYLKSRL
eukprot:TRINITY_DN3418_c0_g3_i1.p1 TRINITY_DN3418_c0_g3~~TRINITY_DN3418_c0_g3_i1.p1  ORF type:complete len:296 (-),score=29.88 TRINITY_DN3418_c0_g3_i1:15-875(-)